MKTISLKSYVVGMFSGAIVNDFASGVYGYSTIEQQNRRE